MAGKILKRSEIDAQYKWKIEDIYPSDEAWEQDYARVEKLLTDFAQFNGKVAEDPRAAIRANFEGMDALTPVYM